MIIEKIMTKDVYTVTPDVSIYEALEAIRRQHIRHLPVVNPAGELLGMVTDRDLRAVANLSREDTDELNKQTVGEIMVSSVRSAHPLDHIDEAARFLYEYKISCLPVLQSGELVGIVTESDILRAMIELLGVNRPGTHLEVEIPDQPGMLAEITQIVSSFEINITCVYMVDGSAPNQKLIVLRLETFDTGPVIAALNKAGYQVAWPNFK